MDEDLREAERKYRMGQIPRYEYAATLMRAGKFNQIEQSAFLGDQEAVMLYFCLLDQRKEIDADNLWVCPYTFATSIRSSAHFEAGQPFPFNVQDSLASIFQRIEDQEKKSALVVDVADLELADALKVRLRQAMGVLGVLEQEELEAVVWYDTLCFTGLAKIIIPGNELSHTERGIQLNYYDCPHASKNQRSTYNYYRILERMQEEPLGLGPKYTPPKRRTKRKLIAVLPERGSGVYVVVVHIPTGRAFALSGNYAPLRKELTAEDITNAMLYANQAADWHPSQGAWRPEWAEALPDAEFLAYWVQE